MPLSKSSFLKYLQCPSYFWFDQNQPEVLQEKGLSEFEKALAEQGKKVEEYFYKLFPDLIKVSTKGSAALDETNLYIRQGATHIAQAAFEAGGYFAQSDLVHFKGEGHIDIYEVKSSSSMQNMGVEDSAQAPSKEEHEKDLAFQYQVATLAGYIVDNTFLVELNKTYTRQVDIDLLQLFSINNVTEAVRNLLPGMRTGMQEAQTYVSSTTPPTTCGCVYKPRKDQCAAFAFLYPEMTGYTVHDLSRIGQSPKRLAAFIDQNIINIEDIPPGHKLLESHRDQIHAWNENREIIHREEIERTFNSFQYPLYFLDYETYAPAIPLFEGTRPYQHIPFQYSLHIIHEKGGEVSHVEFLHTDRSNPIPVISQHLRSTIGDTGTILVWHSPFESGRNKELAAAVPSLSTFLLGLNTRMFDLKDIISKRMYVHKDFRGSASIKKVLPVLVPQLSYASLPINDGGKATSEWGRMVFELNDETEKEMIRQQLLEYCKLDTLAMVEIYRKIKDLTA
jgi:hypothetical protein